MKKVMFLFLITGSLALNAAAPMTPSEAQRQLFRAAHEGSSEKVRELLQVPGIDVNAFDEHGETALMGAVVSHMTPEMWDPQSYVGTTIEHQPENIETVNALLEDSRIDVNALDEQGETALMKAVVARSFTNVKRLLQAGADKNVENEDGLTAEQIAREEEQENRDLDLRERAYEFRDIANFIRDYEQTPVKSAGKE